MIYDTISTYNNNHHHNEQYRDHRKVIIVDWDDTILPSTFVDRWQVDTSKDLPLHVSNLTNEISIETLLIKTLDQEDENNEMLILEHTNPFIFFNSFFVGHQL